MLFSYICSYWQTDWQNKVKSCVQVTLKYYIFFSMNFFIMSQICDLSKQGLIYGYPSLMRVGRGSDKKVPNSSQEAQYQALRLKSES